MGGRHFFCVKRFSRVRSQSGHYSGCDVHFFYPHVVVCLCTYLGSREQFGIQPVSSPCLPSKVCPIDHFCTTVVTLYNNVTLRRNGRELRRSSVLFFPRETEQAVLSMKQRPPSIFALDFTLD